MGFSFPRNFNHPYTAGSFRDFWNRWHISLSTWFRDYVYIPLGGSRTGALGRHGNLWVTMVVSGLWHGAGWTFLVWGAMHAAFMSIERLGDLPRRLAKIPGGSYLANALVLVGVWVAWVMFRCESLSQGAHITARMFVYHPGPIYMLRTPFLFLAVLAARELFVKVCPDFETWRGRRWRPLTDPVVLSLLIAVIIFLRGPGSAFIYFQF